MYVEIILIAVASALTLFLGLVAFMGRRAVSKLDKLDDINVTLARIDERDQHQSESIGALRKRSHGHANMLQHHETRIAILEVKK